MKKIYILLCITFLFQENKAQHTLTPAFNPAVGDIDSRIELDTAGLFPGSSGPSQTWNYTGISTGTNAPYSYTYVPMSSVPNNSLYPSGTIGLDIGVAGMHYVFANTSSKIEWLGCSRPTASACSVTSQTLYPLPFTYGSTYSFTIPSTTATGTTTGDGTGTLQLPSGNYSNILKRTVLYYDSNAISTFKQIENNYYSPLSKFPLLTIIATTITSSSTVTIDKSGRINTLVATSLKEASQVKELNIFPNPVTSGELFLADQKNEILSVSFNNVLGQTVKIVYFGNNTTDNKKVDVSELAKGVYYLRIDSNQGLRTKKIVIE